MKITFAVGQKPDGKLEVLYLGDDADKAKEAVLGAGKKGFQRAAFFRKPIATGRREFSDEIEESKSAKKSKD